MYIFSLAEKAAASAATMHKTNGPLYVCDVRVYIPLGTLADAQIYRKRNNNNMRLYNIVMCVYKNFSRTQTQWEFFFIAVRRYSRSRFPTVVVSNEVADLVADSRSTH